MDDFFPENSSTNFVITFSLMTIEIRSPLSAWKKKTNADILTPDLQHEYPTAESITIWMTWNLQIPIGAVFSTLDFNDTCTSKFRNYSNYTDFCPNDRYIYTHESRPHLGPRLVALNSMPNSLGRRDFFKINIANMLIEFEWSIIRRALRRCHSLNEYRTF